MRRQNTILIVLLAVLPHVSFADLFYDDGGTHALSHTVYEPVAVMDNLAGQSTTLNFSGIIDAVGGLGVYDTSIVNVDGGSANGGLTAANNSFVSVLNGSFSQGVHAYGDSTIEWAGGYAGAFFASGGGQITATDGVFSDIGVDNFGQIDISGGRLHYGYILATQGGQITISGADPDYPVTSRLRVGYDATITLYGSDFWSNHNGGTLGYGELTGPSGHLTGTLLNGVTVSSDYEVFGNGRIILAPEPEPEIIPTPSAVLLGGLGLAVAGHRLRKRKTT